MLLSIASTDAVALLAPRIFWRQFFKPALGSTDANPSLVREPSRSFGAKPQRHHLATATRDPTNLGAVGILKAIVKLLFFAALAAAFTGVALLVRRSKSSEEVSYDEWPDVARKPEAP